MFPVSHVPFNHHSQYVFWSCHTREVVPPKRPNLILPSHIPNVKLDILIGDGLDIEADSRDGSDVGVELQLVEDCSSRLLAWLRQAPDCRSSSDENLLVFPAASKPSMSRRISLDPKILPMIFETWPPILWY